MTLRELRDRIAACGENVLYHHFCETTLRPTFDDPDYRNDFAVWAKLYLRDRVLAERLGILDPYPFGNMEELRTATLDIIDDRLGELAMIPWVKAGDEFLFKEATTVVFDTGERIRVNTPEGAAHRIRYLLHHRERMKEMGKAGREFVRENFLLTPHLRDYLALMLAIRSGSEKRIHIV